MTCVTLLSIVSAEAPGYDARTLIWVGATSGYWATGSAKIAPMPPSMMMIARTQAKIGRSMKIRDIGYPPRRFAFIRFSAPGGGAWTFCGALAGTALIGAPSRKFAVPWVITFSPGARPWVTTQ